MHEEAIKAILSSDEEALSFLREHDFPEGFQGGAFQGTTNLRAKLLVIWSWCKRMALKDLHPITEQLDVKIAPKTFNSIIQRLSEDVMWLWCATYLEFSDVEIFEGLVNEVPCKICMDVSSGNWRGWVPEASVDQAILGRIKGTIRLTNSSTASQDMHAIINTIKSVFKLNKTRYTSLPQLLSELSFRKMACITGEDPMRVILRVILHRHSGDNTPEDALTFPPAGTDMKMTADSKISLKVAEIWDKKERDSVPDDDTL